jgi:hypothetical protein
MIPFGGEYTKAQWARGMRLAMYPQGRGLFLRLLALAICLAGLGVLGVSYFQGNEAYVTRSLRVVWGVLLLAVWALLPFWQVWRISSQPWRGGRSGPSLKGIIKDEGIVFNANTSDTLEKWSAFLRAHVRDDTVVLIGSDGVATVLPRTFFATEDDWRMFRQLVEFNVVSPL